MHIDIRLKLRSMLRRKEQFCCVGFDWDSREIVVHPDQNSYVEELRFLKRNGLTKRVECYVEEPLVIDSHQQYLLYLVSVGDFRKGKIVNGENPLAKGLGLCLFDYVYIFVEQRNQAKKNIQHRIKLLQSADCQWQASLMKSFYQKLYHDGDDDTPSQFSQRKNC